MECAVMHVILDSAPAERLIASVRLSYNDIRRHGKVLGGRLNMFLCSVG